MNKPFVKLFRANILEVLEEEINKFSIKNFVIIKSIALTSNVNDVEYVGKSTMYEALVTFEYEQNEEDLRNDLDNLATEVNSDLY